MRESGVSSPPASLVPCFPIQTVRRKSVPSLFTSPIQFTRKFFNAKDDYPSVALTDMSDISLRHICPCADAVSRECWFDRATCFKKPSFDLCDSPNPATASEGICSNCPVCDVDVEIGPNEEIDELSSDEDVFLPTVTQPDTHSSIQNERFYSNNVPSCALCDPIANQMRPKNNTIAENHPIPFILQRFHVDVEPSHSRVSRRHFSVPHIAVPSSLNLLSSYSSYDASVALLSRSATTCSSFPYQPSGFQLLKHFCSHVTAVCSSDRSRFRFANSALRTRSQRIPFSLNDATHVSHSSSVPEKTQLFFQALFLAPIHSLSHFHHQLPSSTDLTSKCRLPWHVSNRKSSGRILQGLCRSYPKSSVHATIGRNQSHLRDSHFRPSIRTTSVDSYNKSVAHDCRLPFRKTWTTISSSNFPIQRTVDSYPSRADALIVEPSLCEDGITHYSPLSTNNLNKGLVAPNAIFSGKKASSAPAGFSRKTLVTAPSPCMPTCSFENNLAHPLVRNPFQDHLVSCHTGCAYPAKLDSLGSKSVSSSSALHPSVPHHYSFDPHSIIHENRVPVSNPTHQVDFIPHHDRGRSVFVDLTGYDITVSVERLPPVTETLKRSGRKECGNHHTPHSEVRSSPFGSSGSLPHSPPPPYSDCCTPPVYTTHPFTFSIKSRVSPHSCQSLRTGNMWTSSHRSPRQIDNYCWCHHAKSGRPFNPVSPPSLRQCPVMCPCCVHSLCSHPGLYPCFFSYNPLTQNDCFVFPEYGLSYPTFLHTTDGNLNYSCCRVAPCNSTKVRSVGLHSDSCYMMPGPNDYVYIPEPIRVSRSQDVYNALRTCLVPHYELREYFTSAPPQRQWRKLDELSKDGFPFTLMCYNLLSPNYATPNMYPYCPSWALSWDYRRRFILDEIRMYHANIICLQEVETDQFEEIFKPELEKLKYDAVFLPKSRRRTMDMKDCKKVDGCAIFWQVDKFEKVHEFHHEFMFSCSNMCDNPAPLLVNRVMTRDNVALGVIFETKGPTGPDGPGGRQFCVTTGHIHWDPEHSDVKMIQTILWTAELWAYIDQYLTDSGNGSGRLSPANSRLTPLANKIPTPGPSSPAANMPVILCGDLNSLPDSGVVEFLMRGSLPKTHTDFLNNGFKYMFEDWRLLEKWAVDGDTLRHRFTFDRAYRESQGMRTTNFTYEFKGMIDYVLYSRQHFRLLGSLDQIHESWFSERKILGCPHVHFPSDHFALLVELELKPTPQLNTFVSRRTAGPNRCRSETELESITTAQSANNNPPPTDTPELQSAENNPESSVETATDQANAACSNGAASKGRKR